MSTPEQQETQAILALQELLAGRIPPADMTTVLTGEVKACVEALIEALHADGVQAVRKAFLALAKDRPWLMRLASQQPLWQAEKTAQGPEIFPLKALLQKELPPVKWAIPGILPEGLTLLCGKPKMGKSWLVLGFALGIACGGYVLGKVKVEQGHVLYLSLEDNERRLQRRAKQVLQDLQVTPDALYLTLSWPRLDRGGIEHLETWLKDHPDTRLVIVDTWTKIAPRVQGQKRTQYEEDYDALTPLKEIADKYSVSILAVTHLRKMGASDVLDEISGTTGMTGAVDGFLVLKRERGQQMATLHVIGRDIEEEQALALTFDQVTATWTLEGKADEVQMKHLTKERQAIIDVLKAHPQGLSAQAVAGKLGKNFNTVRTILRKMVYEGMITSKQGLYSCEGNELSHSDDSEGESIRDTQA